jgi:hypothetical protein
VDSAFAVEYLRESVKDAPGNADGMCIMLGVVLLPLRCGQLPCATTTLEDQAKEAPLEIARLQRRRKLSLVGVTQRRAWRPHELGEHSFRRCARPKRWWLIGVQSLHVNAPIPLGEPLARAELCRDSAVEQPNLFGTLPVPRCLCLFHGVNGSTWSLWLALSVG